jgi:ferredoxin-NADP reductase
MFGFLKQLFGGNKSTPFEERKRTGGKQERTRKLTVKAVVRETPDAISMVLVDPSGAPLAFEAGQFFTLTRRVNGKVLKRAYSCSSASQTTSEVRLTVKRVAGGAVSPDLVDNLREGETIEAAGPSGMFTAPAGAKRLVLLGGGSGITPLLSIAKSSLASASGPKIQLVYGNRGEADIIFKDELATMVEASGERFSVRHVLEQTSPIAVREGRLERSVVEAELRAIGALDDAETHFLVCGPQPMMDEVKAALTAAGVPAARMKEERFASPAEAADAATTPQDVEVRVEGEVHQLVVPPGLTILEAAQESGVPIPFSCTVGGCASCKVKLLAGSVAMAEPNCLDATERADGYVLACVSKPKGPCTVEVGG